MTTHRLNIRDIDGAVTLLELTGEVDAANARDLDNALQQSTAVGPVILDLSAVEFFDSAGFAVLDRRLAAGGLSLVISPGSVIRKAATLISMPFHDSTDDALTSMAGSGGRSG